MENEAKHVSPMSSFNSHSEGSDLFNHEERYSLNGMLVIAIRLEHDG